MKSVLAFPSCDRWCYSAGTACRRQGIPLCDPSTAPQLRPIAVFLLLAPTEAIPASAASDGIHCILWVHQQGTSKWIVANRGVHRQKSRSEKKKSARASARVIQHQPVGPFQRSLPGLFFVPLLSLSLSLGHSSQPCAPLSPLALSFLLPRCDTPDYNTAKMPEKLYVTYNDVSAKFQPLLPRHPAVMVVAATMMVGHLREMDAISGWSGQDEQTHRKQLCATPLCTRKRSVVGTIMTTGNVGEAEWRSYITNLTQH